jgi:hypothetical protein
MTRYWRWGLGCAALLLCSLNAAQGQISLGKPVTGTSFYNSGSETFTYQNIDDGLFNDTAGDGSTSPPYSPAAPHNWSFWLTPNGLIGSATIDLLGNFNINQIQVQNTHNRGFNDRGTNAYHIDVSTNNVNYTTIITDSFPTWPSLPIVTYNFSPVQAEFVRFNIDSFFGSSGGLNEMSVFGTQVSTGTPEPGALALLACFGVSSSVFVFAHQKRRFPRWILRA